MSPLVMSFLTSAALPAALVSVFFVLVSFFSSRAKEIFQSVAVAVGFAAGTYVIVGRMHFPPKDLAESLVIGAFVLGTFSLFNPSRPGVRYLVRALFVAAAFMILLWNLRESMSSMVNKRNALAFYFLALGVWSISEKAMTRVSGLTFLVLPIVSLTAVSFMLLFKGSGSLSQQAAVLCALLGGLSVLAWLWKSRIAMLAVVPFMSVLVVLFMAGGHFYLDINPWHMVYLAFPFLVLWFSEIIPFVPRSPLGETLVLGAVSAAPLAYFLYETYKISGPLY